jgi:hypothetical protein
MFLEGLLMPRQPVRVNETLATQIPEEFGGTWDAFSTDWCFNQPMADSPYEISCALSTLRRLWPEKVKRLVDKMARGANFVASEIELGNLLRACENITRFKKVLNRLRTGETPAYSEMIVVAVLKQLGFTPKFGEKVDRISPDAECIVYGQRVFFEVYAPERAVSSKDQMKIVSRLNQAIRANVHGSRVEIEIIDCFEVKDIDPTVVAIQSAPPSVWQPIQSWARARRVPYGQPQPPQFDNGTGSQVLGPGEMGTVPSESMVITRWLDQDARAILKVEEKRRQMADGVANMLVINCTANGGFESWPMTLAHMDWRDYEKLGAIAFFREFTMVSPPIKRRRRWRVIVNPAAQVQIPEALLNCLESLDEWSYWGSRQRPQRLVAGTMPRSDYLVEGINLQ